MQNQIQTPPHSEEIEQVVLGALMIESKTIIEVIDILKPETFYKEKHQIIYNAIYQLYKRGSEIDIMIVTEYLISNNKLELVGGAIYVSQLTQRVNQSSNIQFHCRILSEMYIKREIIKASQYFVAKGFREDSDCFEILNEWSQKLIEIQSQIERNKSQSFIEATEETFIEIRESQDEEKKKANTISLGMKDLNQKLTVSNSDFMILAGRPAMGKTAEVLQILAENSIYGDKKGLIFSLEMSKHQLIKRLISNICNIEYDIIKGEKSIDKETLLEVEKEFLKQVQNENIVIDDTPSINLVELRAKAHKVKHKDGLDYIIIDYIQLMSGDSSQTRERIISDISRGIKQVGKELNIPIIGLAQLSRAVESRPDKKPILSDLKESGSLEQDADQVVFIYRPGYYGFTEDEDGNPLEHGETHNIIAKNRHGKTEVAKFKLLGQYQKFIDIEDQMPNEFGQQMIESKSIHDSVMNNRSFDLDDNDLDTGNIPPTKLPF